MPLKKLLCLVCLLWVYNCLFANIVVTNGLIHQIDVKGGKTFSGFITIENPTTQPQSVKLYQTDFTYLADGTTFYEDSPKHDRSNLDWIKLNTNLFTLEGGTKINVQYEITVPERSLPGSNWSVIMVEPVDEIIPSDNPGIQIKSVIRYSIQIVTNNNENTKSLLKFEQINLNKKEDKKVLEVDISNTGDLFHIVTASIEIYDNETGQKINTIESNRLSILPNNSKRFVLNIDEIKAGAYKAIILATTDLDEVFGINVDLLIPDE